MMADKLLTDPKAWLAARRAQAVGSSPQSPAQPEVQYGKIDETPAQQTTAQPGLWDRIKRFALDPAMDSLGGGANMTARALMSQATGDPMLYDTIRASQSQAPSIADSKHPFMYGIKQAVGGMAADTADSVAGFTSPVSLATAGMGVLGKGTGAVAKLAQMGTKAVGTGFALKGAADVTDALTDPDTHFAYQGITESPLTGGFMVNPDAAQKALSGAAMITGGAAGASEQPKYGDLGTQFANKVKGRFNTLTVPGSPAELLTRATKPTVGLPEYEESLNRTIPSLFQESVASGRPIKSVADLADTADTVRNSTYKQYEDLKAPFIKPKGAGPYNPTQVDARPVADAQMASIPAMNLFEEPNQQRVIQRGANQIKQGDPGIVEKTKAVADLYRTDIPVEQADALVRDSNAKLREVYNKIGGKRVSALSNPETARLFAADNTLRSQLYDTIENGTGQDPAPIMQKYGDLVDVGDTAAKRDTIFSRQQPFPLGQQVSDAQALANGNPGQAVLARMFKRFNDSNWLTKEAFERYGRDQQPKTMGKFGYGSLAASVASRSR
jgi:hypothetical protein